MADDLSDPGCFLHLSSRRDAFCAHFLQLERHPQGGAAEHSPHAQTQGTSRHPLMLLPAERISLSRG